MVWFASGIMDLSLMNGDASPTDNASTESQQL